MGYEAMKNKFEIRYKISQKEDLTAIAANLGGKRNHNKSTGQDDITYTDQENSTGENTQ